MPIFVHLSECASVYLCLYVCLLGYVCVCLSVCHICISWRLSCNFFVLKWHQGSEVLTDLPSTDTSSTVEISDWWCWRGTQFLWKRINYINMWDFSWSLIMRSINCLQPLNDKTHISIYIRNYEHWFYITYRLYTCLRLLNIKSI